MMRRLYTIFCFILMSVALYANDTGYVMSDKYREIHYTDIKDADQKLLKYYKERIHNKISDFETYEDYFPYDMFKSLIMSDKRTLEYNFSYCNINERSSPDGKIKLYNWIFDVFVFGTDTRAVLTFSNGEFYGTYASIEENEGFHSLIVPIDTYKIETLQLADGSPLYLFFAGHRNLSSYITSVSAFVFNKDLLEPYNILNVDGKYVSEIDRCTVIGVSNVVRIEYRDGDLYIPQEGYQHHFFDGHICPTISGFKDVYHFDGEKFLYSKTIYDEDVALDSTLRNFMSNIICLEFLPWRVRIDYMSDGNYRYISWKNKEMNKVPDLVINKGTCTIKEIDKGLRGAIIEFKFINEGYEYIVSYEQVEYNGYVSVVPINLIVKYKDKILVNRNTTRL